MRNERKPEAWADARVQLFALYNRLGVAGKSDRRRLQRAITGYTSLGQMTDEEHRQLIEFLSDLTKKPKEKQALTLETLLALPSSNEEGCH